MGAGPVISSKVCTLCGERKPGEEFALKATNSDGLDAWCLACHRNRAAEYRRRNPGAAAAWQRKHREDPENRKRDRLIKKAKNRARARLAEQHSEEYADLLDEERAELGLPPAERRRLVG